MSAEKIEFVEVTENKRSLLKLKVDGKFIPNAQLDVGVIRVAARARSISPAMKANVLGTIRKNLDGYALSAVQQSSIIARFEEEFQR